MKISVKIAIVSVVCFIVGLAFCGCPDSGSTNPDDDSVTLCAADLVSPSDNDTIYADTVFLHWDYTEEGDCGVAERYNTYLRVGEQMALVEIAYTTYDTCTLHDLLLDTVYYWWVVSRASGYDTSVSDTFCFHTNSAEGGLAFNPSPEDGATDVSLGADLGWSVHNPLGETYRYDVYFGTEADPPLAAADLATPAYDPGTLTGNTTYHWKVAAFTNSHDTTWGPIWDFTTSDIAAVYGLFEVDGYFQDVLYWYIELRARFDGVYAPVEPIDPITSYTVEFVLPDASTLPLTLNPTTSIYSRIEMSDALLQLGETYGYSVTRAPFTFDLTLPACVPQITSPESSDDLPNDGFDVEWTGTGCGGYVWLTVIKFDDMMLPDSANVWVYTENDGSYTLTADDLANLEPSYLNWYDIVVIKQEEVPIDAAGWFEESVIRIRLYDKVEMVRLLEP